MPNYFIPQRDMLPAYDKRTGKVIGWLKANEPVRIGTSDYVYHYFRFGTGVAYVVKNDTRVVTSNVPPSGSEYKATTLQIRSDLPYIATDVVSGGVTIYDSTNTVPIAKFAEGYQFGLIGGLSGGFLATRIGDRIARVKASEVRDSKGVPVLCYHNILADSEFVASGTNIKLSKFIEQLDYIKNQGYEVITVEELEQYLKKDLNLPIKTVVITFDDGNKSNFRYAYPELKRRGMKATEFFITKRFRDIEPPEWDATINQTLVKAEMDAMKDVFSFENHTHDMHFALPDGTERLLDATASEIIADMQENNRVLSENCFGGSKYLAYPFGVRDAEAIQAVKDSGVVNLAFTIDTETHALHSGDLYQVPRHMISEYHNPITIFDRAIKVTE